MKTIHEIYFDLCKKHVTKKDRDIVLLQVGSFYEAYSSPSGEGCAEMLSEALNIHLTKKSNKHPFSEKNPKMAGIPTMNLERHLNLLLDNHYRVILYEQNPDNVKDRVYRGCFTKNIRMDFETETSLDLNRDKKIYSIILEKYQIIRNNIKLYQFKLSFAFLELNTAKMFFSETIDNDHYIRMIEQFFLQHHPDEMLFHIGPEFTEDEKKDLKNITDCCFEFVLYEKKKKKFVEMEDLMHECFTKPPHDLHLFPESMENMYYIIQHIREYDPVQTKNLICDDNPWLMMENHEMMKFNRDLYKELFIFDLKDERSMDSKKNYRSIFDLFSHSMNCMGKRKLARMLNSPITSAEEMEYRYSLIENCFVDKNIYNNLIDLESYYLKWKRFTLNPKMVAKLLLVYQSLVKEYPSLEFILKDIQSVWHLKKMMEGEEYFENPSEEYKVWCKEYDSVLEKFYQFEKENLNLTFVENNQDSYFTILTTKWNKLSSAEKDQFRIISSKNTLKQVMFKEFDSQLFVLAAYERKIKHYQKDYFVSTSESFFEKFGHLFISINQKISQDSMYSVLKDFFEKNSYIKPTVDNKESSFFQIENVRHPLIEKLFSDEVFVPFSSQLNSDRNGHMVYGLNRSGKSTYMKSIATSLYLAQCGLYCPCSRLVFSPYFAMYSKLNHSDNLFKQQSLFYNEINELNFILQRMQGERSLVLLDELFQGTEIPSTVGLLLGLVDSFVDKKIQFILSTHIHLISEIIENTYKQRIQISHFQMNEINLIQSKTLVTDSANIFYNRKLLEGPGPATYGIEIAEQLQLPSEIIEKARYHRNYVHLEYDFEPNKKSKYNKDVLMKECALCHSRKNLQVHHIFQQKNFDQKNTNNIHGFQKNNKSNLLVVCQECHSFIENKS